MGRIVGCFLTLPRPQWLGAVLRNNHLMEKAGAPVLTSSERKRAESLRFELEVAADTCHGRES